MTDSEIPGTSLGAARLGPLAITFFVVSAAGPLVAMAGGIPVTMLFGNGVGIPGLFVALTIILLMFAAGYTRMAREFRHAGAFYALVGESLGKRLGTATGLLAVLGYNAMQIGLYGLFGAATSGLLEPLLGYSVPWWAPALVAGAAIALLGYRKLDLSVKLLGVLCLAEYLVVLVLDFAIISKGGAQGISLEPFWPQHVLSGSPMLGLMLGFAAFIGFEATTIYSEEARDPARTVPLATYLALIVIGVFYTLSTWLLVLAIGPSSTVSTLASLADPTTLLFNVADRYVGPELEAGMHVLFVTSTFAAMLAFHNAVARYIFALGRDGVLPRRLGLVHSRYQSPCRASVAQSGLAILALVIFALAESDPVLTVFTIPTAVGTLAILMIMSLAALGVVVFLAKMAKPSPFRIVLAVVSGLCIAAIAIIAATRFDVLTGGAEGLLAWLPLLPALVAAIGYLLAPPPPRGEIVCRPTRVE